MADALSDGDIDCGEVGALALGLQRCATALREAAPTVDAAAQGPAVAQLAAALAAAEGALRLVRAGAAPAPCAPPRREVRVWMDGAFDMMHFGHANAFRQGRALGTTLVVGVNSDASIAAAKGPPVLTCAERSAAVRACKFVDEVVEDVPYVMDAAYVAGILREHRIDYIVHGDDPCVVDGRDVYESAKALGKFKTIPRTRGVSTTDLVGRMLLLAKRRPRDAGELASPTRASDLAGDAGEAADLLRRSRAFRSTSNMVARFAVGTAAPPRGARVVYAPGTYDLFHAGHAAFLARARSLGDYLIAGVHADALVSKVRGDAFPVMNMQERVLSVLSNRSVDDVLVDAPEVVDETLLAAFDVVVVAQGGRGADGQAAGDWHISGDPDPFAVPRARGIFVAVDSGSGLSYTSIADRIRARHERLLANYVKKAKKETAFYDGKDSRAAAAIEK